MKEEKYSPIKLWKKNEVYTHGKQKER